MKKVGESTTTEIARAYGVVNLTVRNWAFKLGCPHREERKGTGDRIFPYFIKEDVQAWGFKRYGEKFKEINKVMEG